MVSKKTKIFENLYIRDMCNVQHLNSPSLKLHSYNRNLYFYFELIITKAVSLNMLGLKLAKLDCIITANELDGLFDLSLVIYAFDRQIHVNLYTLNRFFSKFPFNPCFQGYEKRTLGRNALNLSCYILTSSKARSGKKCGRQYPL